MQWAATAPAYRCSAQGHKMVSEPYTGAPSITQESTWTGWLRALGKARWETDPRHWAACWACCNHCIHCARIGGVCFGAVISARVPIPGNTHSHPFPGWHTSLQPGNHHPATDSAAGLGNVLNIAIFSGSSQNGRSMKDHIHQLLCQLEPGGKSIWTAIPQA